MKGFKCFAAVVMLLAFLLTPGSVWSQKTEKEPATQEQDQLPETLAVLPFENNSVTDPDRFAPLSKGLSAMIITDLTKSDTTLKIIERDKIQALLKEIALGQSGGVDESTAIRVGRVLGAQTIAFGSFMVMGKSMRIDVRIIRVETSELVMAESIMGNSDDFMTLERHLAENIANSLKISLTPKSKSDKVGPKSDINAALYFSKGLNALDQGDRTEAKRLFAKCIELDATYQMMVDSVKGLDQ